RSAGHGGGSADHGSGSSGGRGRGRGRSGFRSRGRGGGGRFGGGRRRLFGLAAGHQGRSGDQGGEDERILHFRISFLGTGKQFLCFVPAVFAPLVTEWKSLTTALQLSPRL